MALSEEEQSRLDALERSLLSSGHHDHSHMPEAERSVRPDDPEDHGPRSASRRVPFAGRRVGEARGGSVRDLPGASGQPARRAGSAPLARMVLVLLLVVAALALYAVSLNTQIPWFGAAGFVLLLVAVGWWMRTPGGSRSPGAPAWLEGARPENARPAGARPEGGRRAQRGSNGSRGAGATSSFMQRLEGRWEDRRRQQGR